MRFLIPIWIFCLLFGKARAVLTDDWGYIQTFSPVWEDENGKQYQLPFSVKSDKLVLSQNFDILFYTQVPDSLYIVVGPRNGELEVTLNGKFLGILSGSSTYFRIPRKWLSPSGNKIGLELSPESNENKSVIGLVHELYLSEKMPVFLQRSLKKCRNVVKAVIIPFENAIDSTVLKRWLKVMRAAGVEGGYFPVETPGYYKEVLEKAGFCELEELAEADSICLLQPYSPENFHKCYWWENNYERAEGYGSFIATKDYLNKRHSKFDRVAISILIFIPVLGLLLFKIGLPRQYSNLVDYFFKSKFYLDQIKENKLFKQLQAPLLGLYRILLLTVSFSLFSYWSVTSGQYWSLQLISQEGLIATHMPDSLPGVFAFWFIIFGVINVLKYVVTSIFSWVYGISGLAKRCLELDILSSFPVNILLFTPIPFLFFTPTPVTLFLIVLIITILTIYIFRRLLLLYQGISVFFRFPVGLKILYICAFEILPWVILL